RRDQARPRRQRGAVARARARPAAGGAVRRHPRRHDPRPRRPRAAALGAHAGGRLPGRLERGRDADGRAAHRRARARRRRARVGRRRPLRAARADRRRLVGRRRARLLAVQVLRPAPRDRLRAPGAARVVAAVQGPPPRGPPARRPVRDRHAAVRALGRVRRRRRVRRVARLGRHRRVGARARQPLPRRPAPERASPRAADDRRPRPDVRVLARRAGGRGGRRPARRARLRRLARQLLRARGDEAARAGGRRRRGPRRLRALQHPRGGRPVARGARAAGVRLRREWVALAALVLVSTALRAWAAVSIPVPWIAPDEMVYGLLGRSLYLHGSLEILGGPTPYYSLLTPALVGFPLSAFGLVTGLDVLQGLQALVMSLAAVPAFLWARSLVSARWALVAAALTVAVPGLTYAGLMVSEVLFYPLLLVAAWAGAEAIARPTRKTQLLLVLAVLAACATRVQAIVLLPALGTAALVDAVLARSATELRRLMPAAGALGALVVAWFAYRLAVGGSALGSYEVIANTSFSAGKAARYVLYHGASLLILCGLFPAAAVALLLVGAVRGGERDP